MENESNLANMLQDLANVAPTQEDVVRLQRKWPGFLPQAPDPPFTQTAPRIAKELQYVIELRDQIWRVWSRTCELSAELESLLLSGKFTTGDWLGELAGVYDSPALAGIIGFDWKRGEIVYRPKTLFQAALYYLLRNIRNAKICGNPDCPAPFFLGRRSSYCSTDCSDATQVAAKRKWWSEHGQEWRENRSKPSKPSRLHRRKR